MRKREFKFFTVMDQDEEAAYLSKMHAEGWRFVRFYFPGWYVFESCEPEKVFFRICAEAGSEAAAGEEKVFVYNRYSYYISREKGPEVSAKEKREQADRNFKMAFLPLFLALDVLFLNRSVWDMPLLVQVPVNLLIVVLALFMVYLFVRYMQIRKRLWEKLREDTGKAQKKSE